MIFHSHNLNKIIRTNKIKVINQNGKLLKTMNLNNIRIDKLIKNYQYYLMVCNNKYKHQI